MSKRTTIHLPVERHEQLKAIAEAHGFAKITEFLDDWIKGEVCRLDVAPFQLTRDEQGRVVLNIDGLPELAMIEKDAAILAAMLNTSFNERRRDDTAMKYPYPQESCVAFGPRGKGYELAVRVSSGWHRRGLTVSLARDLRDALCGMLGQQTAT